MDKSRLVVARWVVGAALLAVWPAAPGAAWDSVGHEIVGRIAWNHMSSETRERAVGLLLAAAPDADLAALLPDDGRPLAEREIELFQRATTWADIVRDGNFPERRDKYHRSRWHYINYFFDQPVAGEGPRDRPDLEPAPENIVNRLEALAGYRLAATLERALAAALSEPAESETP